MAHVRYPLIAFFVLALVVVGYIFVVGRSASRSFRTLIDEQAREVTDLVAEVALRNDRLRREAGRFLDRLDELTMQALASQAGDLAGLRRTLHGRLRERVLLVDAAGKVLLDVGGPKRPGRRDLAPGERLGEARTLQQARRVAQGGDPPDERERDKPFEVHPRHRVFRRVGGSRCLVLVRSQATLESLRLETGLNRVLEQFADDSSVAYLRVEDARGRLAAGFGEAGGAAIEKRRELEMSSGTYTLRVGVDTDAARAVEAEAIRLPLLVGLALLVLAGVAIALVVRVQASYLSREKRLVARAEQDRRLASLGRLTAGVAHEIKNPLNTIQLSVGRLQRKVKEIDPAILAAISRSVTTIARTVEDFMKLARDPALVLEVGDPAKALQEAVSQVRPMAATAGRVLEVVAAATHTKVRLDERRLREALVNLLSNAVQASKHRVEVRLRRDEGDCRIHIDDDGPGIPPGRREEIFEFFFTTKETGTGLGLPLAHRVAEEHGGSLEVAEAPLGGARFTLRLPCLN